MKRFTSKIFAILLVAVMMCATAVPAFAATVKTDPYGFIWEDEYEDVWVIQYYEYSRGDGYTITDYVTLDGTKLYDRDGDLITTIKSMSKASQPTVVFDDDGELYFLISNTSVGHMDESDDSKYEKASISSSSYFTMDKNELGTKVGSKNLSSLSFSGSYSRSTDKNNSSNNNSSTGKKGDYVHTYAYNGDYEKTAYDAYYDSELLLSVYCKGSNVWLETEELLLSDTCVGAKFVGYSTEYSIILYDLDGTVYYFLYDEYDRAYTISLGEEILYYTRDDDGFIKSITTTRKTYELDTLIDEDDFKDRDDDDDDNIYSNMSSVTNTSSKSTAYKSSSKVVATLSKSSNYLYYEGEKLDESYKATYFGFTEDGYPVWINNSGELWYYNGSREREIEDNVTRLQYDNYGFVYRYYIGSYAYEIDID